MTKQSDSQLKFDTRYEAVSQGCPSDRELVGYCSGSLLFLDSSACAASRTPEGTSIGTPFTFEPLYVPQLFMAPDGAKTKLTKLRVLCLPNSKCRMRVSAISHAYDPVSCLN
jgi:hypothetical protein